MITRTAIATAAVLAATTAPAWAAPANDDFEHARAIGPSSTVSGTLAGATHQPQDPAEYGGTPANVWYALTVPSAGPVAIEYAGRDSHVNAPPKVFTGDDRNHLARAGTSSDPWIGRARIDAEPGRTYWILVDGWQARGDFTLTTHPIAAPANDAFADARRIAVPRLLHGNLEESTTELGEQAARPRSSTVWYTIRPRHTGRITVDATHSMFQAFLGAYTGSDLDALHKVAEGPRVIRFTAVRGRTYRLRVLGEAGENGSFALDVSDGSIAGKGVTMKVAPGQSVGSMRRHGLRIDVAARRRVGVDIDLLATRSTARRLHLRSTVLGHLRGRLDYGQDAPATIRLTAAASRALAGRRHLRATLRLTLRDHAPDRVLTVPVGL